MADVALATNSAKVVAADTNWNQLIPPADLIGPGPWIAQVEILVGSFKFSTKNNVDPDGSNNALSAGAVKLFTIDNKNNKLQFKATTTSDEFSVTI